MKILHIAAALAATLSGTLSAVPAAAAAAPASQERVVVSYGDLDLGSRAGMARLDRRILTAVQLACGPTSSADLRGMNLAQECRSRTYHDAVSQVRRAIASASRGGATLLAGR